MYTKFQSLILLKKKNSDALIVLRICVLNLYNIEGKIKRS